MSLSNINPHLSANNAQNSTSCETITIVFPIFFNSSSHSPIFLQKNGSIPLVGSSSRIISGSYSRIFANASLCCCPPLKSYGCCFLTLRSPVRSSILKASSILCFLSISLTDTFPLSMTADASSSSTLI